MYFVFNIYIYCSKSSLSYSHFNIRITRFASFPDYLMIHLKKFTLRQDWTPIKLDVSVEMPEDIDIEYLRGNGPQEGENLIPDSSSV